MRAKNITDLLSLSINLYMLSKDEEFLKDLGHLKEKGKQKSEELYNAISGADNGEEVIEDVLAHIATIKKRLEVKADEVAKMVYEKMHIAHAAEINRLNNEISELKASIARTEAQLKDIKHQNG